MRFLRQLCLILATALALGGCATTPHISVSVEQGAAGVRFATATAATLALNKNPSCTPIAAALSAGIDMAISKATVLTPEEISGFVRAICAEHKASAGDTAFFVTLAVGFHQAYVTTFKDPIVNATDPRVLQYVHAFRDGLNDAVAAVTAAGPS